MIYEVGGSMLSIILLLWSFATHSTHGGCDKGWWLSEGITRQGVYVCTHVPIGGDHRTKEGYIVDDSTVEPGRIYGKIWCTDGKLPIVVDDRIVGCQR